jgi:hypothetical protein
LSNTSSTPRIISWRWRPTAPPANAGPDPHHHFVSVPMPDIGTGLPALALIAVGMIFMVRKFFLQ